MDAMLDADQLGNASYELKTLNCRLSLLGINSDGLLLIKVLIGGQAREVVESPPALRDQLTRVVHRQSHQCMMITYYQM